MQHPRLPRSGGEHVGVAVVVEVARGQPEIARGQPEVARCRSEVARCQPDVRTIPSPGPGDRNRFPTFYSVVQHDQRICTRHRQVQPPVPVHVRKRQVRPRPRRMKRCADQRVTRVRELHVDEGVRVHDGEAGRRRTEIVERGRLLRWISQSIPRPAVDRIHDEQVAQNTRVEFGFGSVPAFQRVKCPVEPGPYIVRKGNEQRGHPFIPFGSLDDPAHADQGLVQLDE